MGVLKIEMFGSDVLRKPAAEITEVDDELRALIKDMFETMYHAEGIGLAGPQVGVTRRVLVADVNDEGGAPFALINPRIVEQSSELDKADEGCLSIPGLNSLVERAESVVVEGLNENGEPVRIEGGGLLARCLQHEIDHLDGVLFIDRLSPLKRNMLIKKWKNLQKREAAEKPRAGAKRAG